MTSVRRKVVRARPLPDLLPPAHHGDQWRPDCLSPPGEEPGDVVEERLAPFLEAQSEVEEERALLDPVGHIGAFRKPLRTPGLAESPALVNLRRVLPVSSKEASHGLVGDLHELLGDLWEPMGGREVEGLFALVVQPDRPQLFDAAGPIVDSKVETTPGIVVRQDLGREPLGRLSALARVKVALILAPTPNPLPGKHPWVGEELPILLGKQDPVVVKAQSKLGGEDENREVDASDDQGGPVHHLQSEAQEWRLLLNADGGTNVEARSVDPFERKRQGALGLGDSHGAGKNRRENYLSWQDAPPKDLNAVQDEERPLPLAWLSDVVPAGPPIYQATDCPACAEDRFQVVVPQTELLGPGPLLCARHYLAPRDPSELTSVVTVNPGSTVESVPSASRTEGTDARSSVADVRAQAKVPVDAPSIRTWSCREVSCALIATTTIWPPFRSAKAETRRLSDSPEATSSRRKPGRTNLL